MKKTVVKTIAVAGLCVSLLATAIPASAAFNGPENGQPPFGMPQTMGVGETGGQMPPELPCGENGAPQVVPSPQTFTVDGEAETSEIYNINGGNYFKLRDMAALLNGTEAQFNVDYDAARNSVVITTHSPYTGANGSELQTGVDHSTSAVVSAQRIEIDGQTSEMTAYNIGGNNFFKLRDLGAALGFGVGYDAVTNTAAITSVSGQANPFEQGQMSAVQSSTGEATEIVAGTTTNSAASLTPDYENAVTYDVSEGSVKITESGTYIITGTSADGNVTVKKGVTGVVLILQDLDLTSTTGATLSVNKTAEAKIIISGSVKLTDAEDPTLEDVSDDYDGAAIKVKAGASAYITGAGTLTVNGSAKNGIKVTGDADEGYGSLVIDGATVSITATNDGINANYDLAILSGTVTISAGDDAIHANRILTIGSENTNPTVTVKSSTEGIEATVVNLVNGDISVTASDDGVNAANSDDAFAGELTYSINVTGANLTVNTSADGLDSNGNVNLVSGSATIRSASNGGDAGIDYDGSLYISDAFVLNNASGVAGPDGMGGMMGGMPGEMGNQMNGQMGGFGGMGGGFQPDR